MRAIDEDETPSGHEAAMAVRDTALRLLARREHSRLELAHKLYGRGHDRELVEQSLDQLSHEGLLDDARFAEVYAASRADKGYGPLKIRADLAGRGVSDTIINQVLAAFDDFWPQSLQRLAGKRFGGVPADNDFNARAKQTRFLRQRGFTLDQINRLFKQAV